MIISVVIPKNNFRRMKQFAISMISVMLFVSLSVKSQPYIDKAKEGKIEVAYFASGCFWCVEAIYESVNGVEEAVSGYAGGHTKNPTYKSTGSGTTGHAETVAVYYDPSIVSFSTLVEVYYGSQNPTTKGQHPDYGSPYRSIIFYQNKEEEAIVKHWFDTLNENVYEGKMVTEIKNFEVFYKAEDYHQDFEKRNPNQSYVKAVSIPRLNRFKKKFPELLK